MALQTIPGCNNHWLCASPNMGSDPVLIGISLDDAADRVTMIGRFTHQDKVTKSVDGVEFLFGPVSKGAGSTCIVSLQDVHLTAGPCIREDGVADQTLTIANADTGFVSNAWYGGDFDGAATRSLAIGELVCVTFQLGNFTAPDTATIRGLLSTGASLQDQQNTVVANLSGTYSPQDMLANVIFRCTDGTFGTLENAWPLNYVDWHYYHADTEFAFGVQLPFPCAIEGMWTRLHVDNAAFSTEYIIYEGMTALQTVTVDHNAVAFLNQTSRMQTLHSPQALAANTLYRCSVRPTGTSDIGLHYTTVNEVGHLTCLPGGTAFQAWSRVNPGAWGAELNKRILGGIRLSAFDDGLGVGGPGHASLQGGLL